MIPPFEMSMDARMLLAKMSNIFERERGTRVKLSRDDHVVALINFGWETLNHEYLRLFEGFCRLLSADEVEELKARGARIYRGAEVTERDEPPAQMARKRVVYRGSVVADGTDEPSGQQEKAAPGRVYRGRVVDDD